MNIQNYSSLTSEELISFCQYINLEVMDKDQISELIRELCKHLMTSENLLHMIKERLDASIKRHKEITNVG